MTPLAIIGAVAILCAWAFGFAMCRAAAKPVPRPPRKEAEKL